MHTTGSLRLPIRFIFLHSIFNPMASCRCITEKPMTPLMAFDSYCWGVDKTKPRMMNPVGVRKRACLGQSNPTPFDQNSQMSSSLTLCPFQGCFTPLPCSSTLLHVPALVQAQAVWSGELRGKESEGTLGLRTMKSVESVPLRQHADTEACWDNAVATHWNTFTAMHVPLQKPKTNWVEDGQVNVRTWRISDIWWYLIYA